MNRIKVKVSESKQEAVFTAAEDIGIEFEDLGNGEFAFVGTLQQLKELSSIFSGKKPRKGAFRTTAEGATEVVAYGANHGVSHYVTPAVKAVSSVALNLLGSAVMMTGSILASGVNAGIRSASIVADSWSKDPEVQDLKENVTNMRVASTQRTLQKQLESGC